MRSLHRDTKLYQAEIVAVFFHTDQDSLTTKPSTTGAYLDCFLQKLYKPTTRSLENT